jgi:phosphoglycolate phosphatase
VNPDLILFDFDFTLVDASGCLFAAIRAGLTAVRGPAAEDAELKPLIGIPLEDQFKSLTGMFDRQSFERYLRAYRPERDAREVDGTKLVPGAHVALAALKQSGCQLGIVSTGAPERIRRTLTRYGISSISGEAGVFGGFRKKEEGIRRAVAHFRSRATDAIYVGDRPDDGEVAHAAGVGFIAVSTGAFGRPDFAIEIPVLGSVAELPDFLNR